MSLPLPTRSTSSIHAPIFEREEAIRHIFRGLWRHFGPQNWWPAETPFEVVMGAFLTQNTSWGNVEKALANLRHAGMLSANGIREIGTGSLEQLIRPSGFFRQKAQRLKIFVTYLDEAHQGSLQRMFATPTVQLRRQLLALNGVGPETADSILLYAGNHEVFVIDAYARRLFQRRGLATSKDSYEDLQRLVQIALSHASMDGLSLDGAGVTHDGAPQPRHSPSAVSLAARSERAQLFNEFHALIVRAGNEWRRTPANCDQCSIAQVF